MSVARLDEVSACSHSRQAAERLSDSRRARARTSCGIAASPRATDAATVASRISPRVPEARRTSRKTRQQRSELAGVDGSAASRRRVEHAGGAFGRKPFREAGSPRVREGEMSGRGTFRAGARNPDEETGSASDARPYASTSRSSGSGSGRATAPDCGGVRGGPSGTRASSSWMPRSSPTSAGSEYGAR
jgi:hypothetical protein